MYKQFMKFKSKHTMSEFPQLCKELYSCEGDLAATAEFYKKWAYKYDNIMLVSDTCGPENNKFEAECFAEYIKDKENALILDVPCGTGLTGLALVNAGFKNIDGADMSQDMLNHAEKKKIYQSLFCGKITREEQLDCYDKKYDGVICVYGLDPANLDYTCAIKEFLRVTKTGGILVYHIRMRQYKLTDLIEFHLNLMKAKEMESFLCKKDFYLKIRMVISFVFSVS